MSYETILYETKERIACIMLNRPRLLNAYNDTHHEVRTMQEDTIRPPDTGLGN